MTKPTATETNAKDRTAKRHRPLRVKTGVKAGQIFDADAVSNGWGQWW